MSVVVLPVSVVFPSHCSPCLLVSHLQTHETVAAEPCTCPLTGTLLNGYLFDWLVPWDCKLSMSVYNMCTHISLSVCIN